MYVVASSFTTLLAYKNKSSAFYAEYNIRGHYLEHEDTAVHRTSLCAILALCAVYGYTSNTLYAFKYTSAIEFG